MKNGLFKTIQNNRKSRPCTFPGYRAGLQQITATKGIGFSRSFRVIATQNRVLAGNSVYAELVRLCDIGKTLFQDSDEAKYNDYVLNLYIGPVPAEDTTPDNNSGGA